MADVHCISVGYPVEMGYENCPGDAGFIVEISSDIKKYITLAEAAVWTEKIAGGNYAAAPAEESLCRKGMLIKAQSIFQLLFQLSELRIVRQGVGTHSAKTGAKTAFRVLMGECAYNLSPVQHILWSNASGGTTLSKIIEYNRDKLMCSEEQLYKEIQGLLYNGLIFFIR